MTEPDGCLGSVEAEWVTVSMLVTDTESARALLACIDDVGSSVRLESMTVDRGWQSRAEIDVDKVTAKQWEAISLAFELGYYNLPREVDLQRLADELSISKSAVSQRLRSAEATLMEAIVTADHPSIDDD